MSDDVEIMGSLSINNVFSIPSFFIFFNVDKKVDLSRELTTQKLRSKKWFVYTYVKHHFTPVYMYIGK